MATLTTSDIKTIDELPEISGDSLTGQDCFLAFDKNSNSHKKIQATAFKAWVTSSAGEAAASARAAAASAANAAASEQAASGSATSAGASATAADGSATLSQSWAVGGTGTRTGEDTNNSRYYAQQSAASATSAAGSSADAADSLAEVRSALATGGIVEGHRTVVVTADMASLADVDTTFRIRDDATLTVRDSSVFSTRITIINETNSPQVVSLTLSGGSGTRVIAAGQSWKYVWTGYWNDGLGIAPAVTPLDTRPVSSGAVQSAILSSMSRGVVPAGVSIDDMVGPEWVGTWFLDAVAYYNLGHRPYVAGSISGDQASLVITCASHPNSAESETVQTLISWNNTWTARRIYINGWLNHSDTPIAGATYGGWVTKYDLLTGAGAKTALEGGAFAGYAYLAKRSEGSGIWFWVNARDEGGSHGALVANGIYKVMPASKLVEMGYKMGFRDLQVQWVPFIDPSAGRFYVDTDGWLYAQVYGPLEPNTFIGISTLSNY